MKNNSVFSKALNSGRNHFTNDFPTHQAVADDIDNSLRWIRFFTYSFLVVLAVSTLFIINGLG